MNTKLKTLVIAGTSSGAGKTTITVGLIAALRKRGLIVQPFKCGPDYIDAGYHAQAAGRPCHNLDSWMLTDEQVVASFTRACEGADFAIVEGVMGLFDGCDFTDERASAAQIAKLLGAPVMLVLDIAGSARSAAATVNGFVRFDPALNVAAVALNFAGSESHALGCRAAIGQHNQTPVLGWLPRDENLRVPERHLGLATAAELSEITNLIADLGHAVEQRFDLDSLLRLLPAREQTTATVKPNNRPKSDCAPLLAVARDDAFCFYYPDNLTLLEEAGVRTLFFSPIKGERLPPGVSGAYLGGGYPELHAAALATNTGLWEDLRALHAAGALIWAECGGFMALTESLVTLDGQRWPMAGLVPGVVRMSPQLAGLGYRHATATSTNLLADAGETLRGHEFHYSTWEAPAEAANFSAWLARSTKPNASPHPLGYAKGNLLASYLHIHLGQKPLLAGRIAARLSANRISSTIK